MQAKYNALLLCLLLGLFACSQESSDEQLTKNSTPAVVKAVNGEEVYQRNCISCHAAGPGHPGTMRLAIRLGEDKSVLTERDDLLPAYVKTIVRQGILLMPPFRPAEISDRELEALAGYLANKTGS